MLVEACSHADYHGSDFEVASRIPPFFHSPVISVLAAGIT